MAPEKRRRVTEDDGETEILDVESASSSLQQVSRKKPRISYDEPESSGHSDSSDDEFFQEHASQFATQQQSKHTAENLPADNGIIETVTCINFMCHGFLEINLGPLINFIIGHNGSGKSAVLTAITICLGGKATSTNRGQSLKSFIKEGEETAMLSVKIKNRGNSAYQQDVFGNAIIVERHFSRSGSSNFKIKNSVGRLISARKGDLDDICDFFALQIDNPMNVLTQDMARQFLNNSSPAEKYKFFMKGTQLEHLDGDYLIVENNVDIIEQDLWKKAADVQVFESELQKARELHGLSEKQDVLRERIQTLGYMMAWAQVEEVEEKLAREDEKLRCIVNKITTSEMNAVSFGEAFDQTEQSCNRAASALHEVQTALVPLQKEKDAAKKEFDRLKAEQMGLHTDQRSIEEELRAAEAGIKRTQNDIDEEHKRLSDADGGGHAMRRREIDQKREEAEAAKIRVQDHGDRRQTLLDNRKRADDDYQQSQNPIKAQRREIKEKETRFSSLMRDQGQQQQSVSANMARLLSAIRQDKNFLQKPLGPLGNHVRLLKPVWSSVLEKSFGGSLDAFIVTSKQDQNRLSDHMHRCNCSVQILIGNNRRIDTAGKEPDEHFNTVLRSVEIDDDLVRKQLILQHGIDQTVLIEDRETAIDTMNSGRVNNLRQCFALTNKRGEGVRLGYGFGGGLSQTHMPAWNGLPRMKTDIEYQINAQCEIIQSAKAELNQLEQSSKEKQNHLVKCEQAIKKHAQETEHLKIEMQRAETIVDDLQDALDQDSIEEGRLEALKQQLKEAQEEKKTHGKQYEEFIVVKDRNNIALKNSRSEMSRMDRGLEEANAKIRKADTKATNASNQRAAALRDKNAAIEAVETGKREREQQREERDAHQETVNSFTRDAEAFCPRVPVDPGATCESLEEKMDKIQSDLEKMEKRVGGTRGEMADAVARTFEAYDRAKKETQDIEELAQVLKETLVNRRSRWKMFQRHITARARVQFMYLLSERGFRGQLQANHKQKALDLKVEPDETLKANQGRKTMTLSGGEKSFSTICLLLALWEAMGAPIRCLDEFDVFMDSVNREISMKMMIDNARSSMGKQFVLITPQAMGNVGFDPDIKCIRMQDPNRGNNQSRINFPRANGGS